MRKEGVARAANSAALRADGPATRGAARAGLAQRAGSGRIGVGQQCPAGHERVQGVVTDARRQVDGGDAELGRQVGGGGAAEAVAAAGKSLVMPMLMLVLRFGVPVMVGVLLRAGLVVSAVQMKRGMGVA